MFIGMTSTIRYADKMPTNQYEGFEVQLNENSLKENPAPLAVLNLPPQFSKKVFIK
jgi:hypothetical protein